MSVLALGDSKTSSTTYGAWAVSLTTQLNAAGTPYQWHTLNLGVDGSAVAAEASSIASHLSRAEQSQEIGGAGATHVVVMNFGVNDAAYGLPNQTTWQNNYLAVIDAIVAKWPEAVVYIMRPWRRGDTDGRWNTMAGWIDNIVAARPGVAILGPDERVWLEGGDDGATMTYDGVHYTTVGQAECAAQWKAILLP